MNLIEVLSKITKDFPDEREKEIMKKMAEEENSIDISIKMIDNANKDEVIAAIGRTKYFWTDLYRTVENALLRGKELYAQQGNEKMAEECSKTMAEWKEMYSKEYLMLELVSSALGKNETGNA